MTHRNRIMQGILRALDAFTFARSRFAAPLLVVLAASVLSAASGTINYVVRDVYTHYAVPATIKLEGPESLSLETDDIGGLTRAVTPGKYRIQVSAPGYENMKSYTTVEPGKTDTEIFMLHPVNPPEEEGLLDSRRRPGFTLVHGYATDERSLPAPGVRVRLQKAGVETMTDDRGYYWLSVPTPPEPSPGTPGTDTLIAEKPGYKTILHRNMIVAGEAGGGALLHLERGAGTVEHDDTHKLMRKEPERGDQRSEALPARVFSGGAE